MWYFNGSKFTSNQEKVFKSTFTCAFLDISDEYEVMFPEGENEESNPFFNGYKILIEKNKVIKKQTDKLETGNWITYAGKINKTLRSELKKYFL